MSRPRFLADNDLNDFIVDGVLRREPEVEFLRLRHVAPADLPDAEVLSYANENGLILVSHDVNTMPARAFERIASGENISGLVMIQQSLPIGFAIEELLLVWATTEAEEWVNNVVFLPI